MFYTYLWLRENGTPYYVGKGSGDRSHNPNGHRVKKPSDDRIIVQRFECEEDAFFAEKFLIALYGRTDNGTGCLSNLTDGGESPPSWKGRKRTEENIRKSVEARTGMKRTPEQRRRISEAHKGLSSNWKGHKHSEKANRKNREAHLKSHCKNGHEFTPENTYVQAHGWKVCKLCRAENQRIRRKKVLAEKSAEVVQNNDNVSAFCAGEMRK